jgi:5-methylcytosine-specific restriction protein A
MSTTIKKGSIQQARNNLKANIDNDRKKRHEDNYHNNKYSKYYGSKAWKELRNWYISNHVLCENCLRYNIFTPAECVHHKQIFSHAVSQEDKYNLLLAPQNCMSLCESCHQEMHNIARTKGLDYIDECIPIKIKYKDI